MHDKIRGYIRAALHRRYPIETIIGNLVSVGHDEVLVRRLAREVIMERLRELEQEKIGVDPIAQAERTAQRTAMEVLVAVLLRLAIGALFFFTFIPFILEKVHA
ncbi:hypothetical protein HY488_03665 [Candidatus Woesearchaeota archaeon]|nr:hypothetical protein [Candidatus Woesearchaeota archaeon]